MMKQLAAPESKGGDRLGENTIGDGHLDRKNGRDRNMAMHYLFGRIARLIQSAVRPMTTSMPGKVLLW